MVQQKSEASATITFQKWFIIDQLSVALFVLCHEPSQTLLLNPFLLFLLLPLCIGMPCQHGLVQFLNLRLVVLVKVAKISAMCKNCIKEILKNNASAELK